MYHRERSNSTNNLLYQQQHLQQQFRNASNSTYANDEDDYVERSGDQDDYEGRMYNDVDGGDDNGESYDGGRGSNNNNNNNSYQSNDYLEVMSNSSRSSASRNSGHYNKVDPAETNKNFKVVIRVRPPLPRELEAGKNFVNIAKIEHDNVIILSENLANEGQEGVYTTHSFTFDKVYGPDSQQKDVYEHTAKEAVLSTLQGYNATMIAYGQTGTGKTYTMEGFTNDEQRGIVPRATEEIFNYIQNTSDPKTKFLVRASYLQIYNEVISDLLKPERKNLMIREDKKRGVFVEGLSEWVVRSPAEIYGLMERGGSVRATGATKMNEMSSRSHAVFIIICEQSETTLVNNEGKELGHEDVSELLRKKSSEITRMSTDFKQSFKIGKLNLVDLAGSERVRYTGATGVRLEESKKINQSLSALGNVIAALTDSRGRQHIPYRDSKLTRILADSLGGNCKTTMMAMISPALESFAETLSTVKFANRSKNIKNEAHVNEDLDQRALLRKYERELKKLRAELEEKSKNVVSKRRLLELEEQKKRAEEDKLAAITALEKRSREFMQEKLEKRKLEEKIARMQSQLLIGGQKIEDTPQFRHAIQQSLQKVHKQYEDKLAELERERQTIEEDKAQVDRYKQLLLKQRDIMIALTARLNERDESILGLQEELDAYDGHQRMMEDALDQKTASLIHLQRVALEQNLNNAQRQQLLSALGEWAIDYGAQQQYQQPVSKDNERRYPPHESQVVFGLNSDGDGPYLLTAEEKIQELTRLLEKHQGDQSMVAQELEEVQAEKVSMEYLLREKLEKMVQNEIEERINAYKREVEHWKSLLAVAEEKCRAAEYKAELSKLDSGSAEFRDKISDILRREMEILQKPFNEKAAQMKADLEKAVAEKKKAVAECDKLRLELETLKQMQKTNTKFYAAQQLQLQQQQQLQHQKMSEASSKIEDQAAMLRNYEEQIKRLQQQQQQQHNSSSASTSGSGNTAEITMLKQQIATSMKERQALKTILEAKIKSMVDSISRQINSITATQSPPDSQKLALQKDITALQKLVNASIQAMKNSEEEMKELYGASAFTGSNSNNNNISTTTNNNNSNGGSVSGASLSTSSSNSSLSSMDSTSSSSSSSVPSTPTSAVTPTAITSSAFSSRSSQLQQQRQPSAQLRSSATTPVSGTSSSSSSSSYTHHRSSSFSSTSSPYVSASVAGNNNSAINNGNSNSSSSINNNNNSSNDHNTQQNLLQQRKLQQQQLVEQLLEQNKRSKEQQQQQQMQYSSSHSSSLNGGNTTYHHYN